MSNPHPSKSAVTIVQNSRRSRIRTDLLTDPDSVNDIELIEAILFTVVKRLDVRRLSNILINRYGTLASVISAPVEDLLRQPGMSFAAVAALKSVFWAAKRLARAEFKHGKTLDDWQTLSDFLLVELSKEKTEKIVALYLDDNRKILANEIHGQGNIMNVAFEMRKLVGRALELDATCVIVAHNHPSGDIRPSIEDIKATKHLKAALQYLDIELLDHLIVGNGSCLSFRSEYLLP